MNEKIKAALGFSESEAFDHICYQYRATPMVPTAEVVTNFTAVKDAVTAAIAEAYRLGQERMRERCAAECDGLRERWAAKHGGDTAFDAAYCTGALSCSHVIRALPVDE